MNQQIPRLTPLTEASPHDFDWWGTLEIGNQTIFLSYIHAEVHCVPVCPRQTELSPETRFRAVTWAHQRLLDKPLSWHIATAFNYPES